MIRIQEAPSCRSIGQTRRENLVGKGILGLNQELALRINQKLKAENTTSRTLKAQDCGLYIYEYEGSPIQWA